MVTQVSGFNGKQASLRSRAVAAGSSARAVLRSNAPVAQVVRFVWHYVQMAIAMELGMFLRWGSS